MGSYRLFIFQLLTSNRLDQVDPLHQQVDQVDQVELCCWSLDKVWKLGKSAMIGAEILDSIGGDIDKCYQNVLCFFLLHFNVTTHKDLCQFLDFAHRRTGMLYSLRAVLGMRKLPKLFYQMVPILIFKQRYVLAWM